MNNVSKILLDKMCSGCGACFSICPKECINFIQGKFVNYPQIEESKCIDCGLCLKVCPSEKNIVRLTNGIKINNEDKIEEIKVCYSTDDDLRVNSASGGAVTQIIKYMLEKSEIDGAVVVTQSTDNILMNSVEIIDNVKGLRKSQGSRYSPSSNCIILKDLIKSDKYKKVIFVGKPCDIEALSNFENINSDLKDKISLKIAIMCHHSPTRKGVINLLNIKKFNVDEIRDIKFRGNGWPGYFEVINKNGQVFRTTYFDAWNNYLSRDENVSCMYCDNPFPLEADLIVGDPWGDEYKSDDKGQSLIIVRSIRAKNIISDLEKNNNIISRSVTYDDVQRYQENLLIRYNQFYLNVLLYKKIHGKKITLKDYRNVVKENPKSILRFIKRVKVYTKLYNEWNYE